MTRRRPTAAAVVFALLVLATVAAFAYAQQKKRDPLIVDRVEIGHEEHVGPHRIRFNRTFNPRGASCATRRLPIRFRTTTSNDATIQVVRRPGDEEARTLVSDRFFKRYTLHALAWNGLDDAGDVAPAGRYRVRVLLEDEDRDLLLPGTIELHVKPAAEAVSIRCFKPARKAGGG